MNSAMKGSFLTPPMGCFYVRAALFHSTPILEGKRRNFWECKSSNNSKRHRRGHSKQAMFRNLSDYTDYLFQTWKDDIDGEVDPFSSRGPSWFKKEFSKGSGRDWTGRQKSQRWGRKGFSFCEDDVEDEIDKWTIFRSAFGGNRHFHWSFTNEDNCQYRHSSGNSNTRASSWTWSYKFDEDDDSSTESESLDSDMSSDRLTLGLRASGPLKLTDVKAAYRACALKWHPDRHHGCNKAIAEEKFKHCSAAYEALRDKLAMN
ncbi:DnaJ domain-containing protein [Cephalotus follicularis]|uniref:DnaJ domain-containing protein n=1 Tax=Cephalotus follicularis TaxID=3775 RepID=A0A1Q3B875_CEPFO|nr:DnaJ domain-containing protein [Cephalotus follicularis]